MDNTPSATENNVKKVIRPKSKVSTEKQKKQQQILLALLVVVVVAIGYMLYRNGVIGGSSAEKPIEDYFAAIAACDFESYVETMPDRIAADHRADREELGLSGEEYMRELYSDFFTEFGDDMTISVEITDRSRPDAIYVDNFRSSYAEIYGEEIQFSSVFEIDASAFFSGSSSSEVIDIEGFVIKTGGKWKIVGCDYKTEDASASE